MVSMRMALSSFSFGAPLGAGAGFVLGAGADFVLGALVVPLFMDGNRDPIGFPPELAFGSFVFFRDGTTSFSRTKFSAKPSTVLTLALLLEIAS